LIGLAVIEGLLESQVSTGLSQPNVSNFVADVYPLRFKTSGGSGPKYFYAGWISIFLPLGQKNLIRLGKKKTRSKPVGPFFTAGKKQAWVGSGHGPSLFKTQNPLFISQKSKNFKSCS